jgi:hypothetical protein
MMGLLSFHPTSTFISFAEFIILVLAGREFLEDNQYPSIRDLPEN